MSYETKVKAFMEKFEEYNKINKDIKRFGVFNSFSFTYKIEKHFLYFELKNTDDDAHELFTAAYSEESVFIDINNDNDANWLIKTINRLIEKAKETMKKARDLAKPHVGLLVYDDYKDRYFLDPVSGEKLLNNPEISKIISSTRLDLFSVFLDFRKVRIHHNSEFEIVGMKSFEIIELIDEITAEIRYMETQLKKIEGMPRYICNFGTSDKINYNFSSYATDAFPNQLQNAKKINEINLSISLEAQKGCGTVYNLVRMIQDTSKQLLELSRAMIAKNEPNLYKRGASNKLWLLTPEGNETMKSLNLMDFLDKDKIEIPTN
ncbi:hypothetical protein [Spiroplasma helicoides]|nr:hypothetical protein [Spiroplasma helicoides]